MKLYENWKPFSDVAKNFWVSYKYNYIKYHNQGYRNMSDRPDTDLASNFQTNKVEANSNLFKWHTINYRPICSGVPDNHKYSESILNQYLNNIRCRLLQQEFFNT